MAIIGLFLSVFREAISIYSKQIILKIGFDLVLKTFYILNRSVLNN